jgi:hypothetical protein
MYNSKTTDLDGIHNRGEQREASEEAKFHLCNMKLPTIYIIFQYIASRMLSHLFTALKQYREEYDHC